MRNTRKEQIIFAWPYERTSSNRTAMSEKCPLAGFGGGNATIRAWQCETPPRSAGIPTGTVAKGGYATLTPEIKANIDQALDIIRLDIDRFHFKRVFFSSCEKGSTPSCTLDEDLGSSIFIIPTPVRAYIVTQLKSLEAMH